MATESPLSLTGSGVARNWPVSNDSVTFSSSRSNVAAQELSLLLNGHKFQGDGNITGPNRCGSAPPSIESSLVALDKLTDQHNSSLDSSFESLSIAVETRGSEEQCCAEEQLRAHPAYRTYYCSNVNLNPRLPPPLISRENQRLVHHIGRFTDNRRMPSFDDSSMGPLFISRTALSTHKEEPEDGSPRLDRADENAGFVSRQFTSPLHGRHKSLVDLIQEDFPRTPSPVYNNQSRPSSHSATEQAADSDTLVHSLHDSSTNMAIPDLETAAVGVSARTPISCVPSVGSVPNSDVIAIPFPCSADSEGTVNPHRIKGKSCSNDAILDNCVSPNAMPGSKNCRTDKETKNLKIFNEGRRSQHAHQLPHKNRLHPQGTSSQLLAGQSQMVAHGIHYSNAVDPFSHDQSKLSSVELQPVLQSPGIAPPLYATAAAYGTPFYVNLQPSSIPPFGIGGYALNPSLMPPLITGYPPNSAIHVPFDNHASPNFNIRTSGLPTGGSITTGVDMQQFYKFYGQLGVAIQPSFPDPSYVPYFPHPSVDAYIGAGRYDPMLSGGSAIGSPPGNYDLQRGPSSATYLPDQRPQDPRSGSVNTPTSRRAGIADPNYYGNSPSISALMQYQTSPLLSPVFQGSPGAGTNFSVRNTENMKLPLNSGRTAGVFYGQGQRGRGKVDDPNLYSFLEELKSSKGRRFELPDIAGRVVDFSTDQHGSRFIQQKLETCSIEEKTFVFEEVLPHASTLMTDVFGNYVIQKFFEHGSPVQRKELANQLVGHILPLSLQMYGCRVIQKALEVIELDQKTLLVYELDGHVMRCVRDQNGNHVIQKCIECVPTDKIGFIISSFRGQVATLSMHPYGCRVIQRVLEHCTDELQSQCIVDEILQSVCVLAQDQYGNYVTQHVLERGKSNERRQIISKLAGQVVQMSQHKFASNVIEKCLEHGDIAERELLIEEIVGQTEGNDNLLDTSIKRINGIISQQDLSNTFFTLLPLCSSSPIIALQVPLQIMMKDQFANYVVQKFLETCTDNQREILLNRVRSHLQALKKYTYGKHIVARIEQLSGEETNVT